MALINCPECKKKVSDTAEHCPNCGFAVKAYVEKKKSQQISSKEINESSSLIGIIFIAVIICVCFLLFKACSTPTYDSNDGKCDICGKSATEEINGEEYCNEHYGNALEWYVEQSLKK